MEIPTVIGSLVVFIGGIAGTTMVRFLPCIWTCR